MLKADGLAALGRRDYAAAVRLLTEASGDDPYDYDVLAALGMANIHAGRPQDAVRALTDAVLLRPSLAAARYNLGVAYEHAGDPGSARAAYAQATELDPAHAGARQALRRLEAPRVPAMPAGFGAGGADFDTTSHRGGTGESQGVGES